MLEISFIVNSNYNGQIKNILDFRDTYGDIHLDDIIHYILRRYLKRNIYIEKINIFLIGLYDNIEVNVSFENNNLIKPSYTYKNTEIKHIIFFDETEEKNIKFIDGHLDIDLYNNWKLMDRLYRSFYGLKDDFKNVI